MSNSVCNISVCIRKQGNYWRWNWKVKRWLTRFTQLTIFHGDPLSSLLIKTRKEPDYKGKYFTIQNSFQMIYENIKFALLFNESCSTTYDASWDHHTIKVPTSQHEINRKSNFLQSKNFIIRTIFASWNADLLDIQLTSIILSQMAHHSRHVHGQPE